MYTCRYIYIYIYIWTFPELGVPPNHPFYQDFPLETIHFGVPPLMETPIYIVCLAEYNILLI